MLSLGSLSLGFSTIPKDTNPCDGMKYSSTLNEVHDTANTACFEDFQDVSSTVMVGPQSGADVSTTAAGMLDTTGMPAIQDDLETKGLCAVNVHWHEGAEHRSAGEYDETFTGPGKGSTETGPLDKYRQGHHCSHYEQMTEEQKKPYVWKYCEKMYVGETYEVHWPHSAAGMCGTKWQFQTPFYDGVLCNDAAVVGVYQADNTLSNMAQAVGVEGQVFTIVNDPAYDLPLNMHGALKFGDKWQDVAKYTGSTTGTTRDNTMCSKYSPITWQVDRKCHMISAKSFDNLCMMMHMNGHGLHGDDMHDDMHPHGARETVLPQLTGTNVGDGVN
jgi:hypothetical protein